MFRCQVRISDTIKICHFLFSDTGLDLFQQEISLSKQPVLNILLYSTGLITQSSAQPSVQWILQSN